MLDKPLPIVKATIVGSNQDINPTTATPVVWSTIRQKDPDDTKKSAANSSVDASKIEVYRTGLTKVYVSIGFSSSSARVNPRVRIRKNGTDYCVGHGLGGYVRAASGHNEGSTSIMTQDFYERGDYFEVMVDRAGAAGTCTPIDSASILLVDSTRCRTYLVRTTHVAQVIY